MQSDDIPEVVSWAWGDEWAEGYLSLDDELREQEQQAEEQATVAEADDDSGYESASELEDDTVECASTLSLADDTEKLASAAESSWHAMALQRWTAVEA